MRILRVVFTNFIMSPILCVPSSLKNAWLGFSYTLPEPSPPPRWREHALNARYHIYFLSRALVFARRIDIT